MKRFLIVALFASIGVVGLLGLPTQAASKNNFEITSYDVQMTLGRDADKRSTLRTVETITADFQQRNQNHGLERAIPESYDGHPVSLSVKSVTDEAGRSIEYSKSSSNDMLILRAGNANEYVFGKKTYVITYEQRDVTKVFADTNSDEFYWDINGTQWQVPIRALSLRLTLDPSIRDSLTGKQACYSGSQNSTTRCAIEQDEGGAFTVSQGSLQRRENVTVAIGFSAGTFAAYEQSLSEILFGIWIASLIVTSVIGVVVMIWLFARLYAFMRRTSELGTIVPEYLPPKEASVTTSGHVLSSISDTFTAQLLDFAVRHYIKIYQIEAKSRFRKADYELEITGDVSKLRPEEFELLSDLFNGKTAIGTRLDMSTLAKSTSLYKAMQDNPKKLQNLVRGQYGLYEKNPKRASWFKKVAWIVLSIGIVTLSPVLLIAALVSFILGATFWQFSDTGLALYRYLQGLKNYIKVAEKDRLTMLQSAEGAQKLGAAIDGNDTRELVKLYEKVLPYAALFGQEKSWNQQLGRYYEQLQTQPGWFDGGSNMAVFNAVAFSSALNGFSASASTYSPATSSSSGGSSGGGFSGGGGGGGGGGGW